MADKRERPWRRLRVVVEVTVPPTSNATEKDLAFLVKDGLPETLMLRRPIHENAVPAVVRVKQFMQFWPMFLRKERGLSIGKKKVKRDDEYNGL